MQRHTKYRHCPVRILVRDVGSRYCCAVQHRHSALTKHAEIDAWTQLNGRVLVDADTEHARVLTNDAEQSVDASALGEVLVDHHVPHKSKASAEPKLALDAVRFPRLAIDHH